MSQPTIGNGVSVEFVTAVGTEAKLTRVRSYCAAIVAEARRNKLSVADKASIVALLAEADAFVDAVTPS